MNERPNEELDAVYPSTLENHPQTSFVGIFLPFKDDNIPSLQRDGVITEIIKQKTL